MAALLWLFNVAVLMRNSLPILLPALSNICALAALPLLSPPSPLESLQLTTNPPERREAISGAPCEPAVTEFTKNSPPTFAPLASKTCALMSVKSPLAD